MDACNVDGNPSSGLTRIIPEQLVSVKLETSPGGCSNPAPPEMQDDPSAHRPPPFAKPPPTAAAAAAHPPAEFSAWVQTGQAEGHHHPAPTNPGLRIPNGGLVSGDVCDSSAFLNYVLNQQRSNGIFVFEPPAGGLGYASGCQGCVAKTRDGVVAYRDASTNTPGHEPRSECAKCRTKTPTPTAKSFYGQLGLQPHRPARYEAPCKACGRPNSNPNTTVCGNCNEPPPPPPVLPPAPSTTPCKCVQDCNSDCVRDNRRLHFLDVDRPYTCEICLKNYPSESSLVNHLRYHKGNRPYQCETCNKAFATNSHLTTHRRTHSGERPFECPDCFKTFSDRSSFAKHSRTHGPDGATVRKFKCPVCGNAFVDSCGLKKHIRIHTGERPYVCGVCDKAFATSSTFVAHKRIHSGERPYSCATCSKRFITKSHLLTHGRVHSGEKPFCCQVCNRAFADGSSYRRHERLHTGENRYTCDVCGKGFPYETSLAKHKQSHVPGTSTYVYMTA